MISVESKVYKQLMQIKEADISHTIDDALEYAASMELANAAIWITEHPELFAEAMQTGFSAEVPEATAPEPDQPKRQWTRREAVIPLQQFGEKILQPIMGLVNAKRIPKNVGMIVAALCGRPSVFPTPEYLESCSSNPLQTMNADITKLKLDTVAANDTDPCNVVIPVYPTLNDLSDKQIARFKDLCSQYNVHADMFFDIGGTINLDSDFLKLCCYFATDKGLTEEESIWDGMKPMKRIPVGLLEPADRPTPKERPPTGKKRGRPRKNPISDMEQTIGITAAVAVEAGSD